MMNAKKLSSLVVAAMDELKAQDIVCLDVRHLTSITDYMVIGSGSVDRHVKAIADNVIDQARKEGVRASGVEGEEQSEWLLIDLDDVLVHVMLPRTRDFYQLEKLWDIPQSDRSSAN